LSEANKELIRRFYETVWHQSNIGAIDTIFDSDFVNHDPGPHSPDREGFKQYVGYARKTADYQPTIDDLIAEGDKVVVRITGQGRLKKKFLGVTPGESPG
jgi:predicted ester cyclase